MRIALTSSAATLNTASRPNTERIDSLHPLLREPCPLTVDPKAPCVRAPDPPHSFGRRRARKFTRPPRVARNPALPRHPLTKGCRRLSGVLAEKARKVGGVGEP